MIAKGNEILYCCLDKRGYKGFAKIHYKNPQAKGILEIMSHKNECLCMAYIG